MGLTGIVRKDPVSWIAAWQDFEHAKMDTARLREGAKLPEVTKCSNESAFKPSWEAADVWNWLFELHAISGYNESLPKDSKDADALGAPPHMAELADLGYLTGKSLMEKVGRLGRNLVASVVVRFGSVVDVAHLVQDPGNKECVLVFRGSDSYDIWDWLNNLKATPTEFCGFKQIHKGFKIELFGLLTSAKWDNIRRSLPQCSKVLVTGHSLGGAQAELFSACANRAPGEGQEGHDDYKLIGWTQGIAKAMPAIDVEPAPCNVTLYRNQNCSETAGSRSWATDSEQEWFFREDSDWRSARASGDCEKVMLYDEDWPMWYYSGDNFHVPARDLAWGDSCVVRRLEWDLDQDVGGLFILAAKPGH